MDALGPIWLAATCPPADKKEVDEEKRQYIASALNGLVPTAPVLNSVWVSKTFLNSTRSNEPDYLEIKVKPLELLEGGK